MGFGWLGTFRNGQWDLYRSFLLRERADVSARVAVIQAEMARIGQVTISYRMSRDGSGRCTEERTGFSVSENSSLEKLIRAYTVAGGNPFDVSMFLIPDSVVLADEDDPTSAVETQPYGGVIAPRTGDPAVNASFYGGGYLNVLKYTPARTNSQDAHDSNMASAVSRTREWVGQVIDERLHSAEARIIKLCDLREQLGKELDLLQATLGGTVEAFPMFDPDVYALDQTLAVIVTTIDEIIYRVGPDGYPTSVLNEEGLAGNQNVMTDILPDEANTIL
jgi:hypothetical protein